MNNLITSSELQKYTPTLDFSRTFEPTMAESALTPGIEDWNGQNKDISIAHRQSLYFLVVIYNLADSFLKTKLGEDYSLPVDVRTLAEKCNFIVQTKDFTSLRQERNDRTYSPVAQLQMRGIMSGENKGKIAGIINVADYLGETSIRFSIAHELAHYVLRKHNPIGLNYIHEACPGMYPLSDSDEMLSDLLAYALLLPYDRFLRIKEEYENNNSRWPIDYSDWIRYLRDKTQMPEYHVALAYHTIKQYAIARRTEKANSCSIDWLHNLVVFLSKANLSKTEIKGLLSYSEARGIAKDIQTHLSETIDLIQEKLRAYDVKNKESHQEGKDDIYVGITAGDLLSESEDATGCDSWKKNIIGKLFVLGMSDDEMNAVSHYIGVKPDYMKQVVLEFSLASENALD